MPLRKKRTAPWTPNGAGRRFHSASGTEKYNPSARFAGTSFYTREVLAGRFTEPCALLFALKARKPRARNARPYGDGTSPSYVGSLDPVQNGESPSPNPRPRRRGLRGNMVPPSNRARPAVRCRTAFPQKCRDLGGKATGLYKNGGGAVFLFHMKHFLAFPSAWV